MTDRELLELAAKAAGYEDAQYKDMEGWGEFRYGFSHAMWLPTLGEYWNPLTDDGDALRLAVKLELEMFVGHDENGIPEQYIGYPGRLGRISYVSELRSEDPGAATRRAIVRAAAAQGGDGE
ncbi:hypothetical protein [Ralstonia holmesii]|uniref:hypothetical protein n=1 Tax=Ralstonia holmesii TaxID=3058602 RepID=UPI003F14687A